MSNEGQKRGNYQHNTSLKVVKIEIKTHANNRTLNNHCNNDRSVNFHLKPLIRGVCFTKKKYLPELLFTGIKTQKKLFSFSLQFQL